jgi:hypothetical protein
MCPHCRRRTRSFRGVCTNCGGLKREAPGGSADAPVGDPSWSVGVSLLSEFLWWAFGGLVVTAIVIGLAIWLALHLLVVVMILVVLVVLAIAASQLVGW